MIVMQDVPRLYYDAQCHLCSDFAHLVRSIGGRRVRVLPFRGPEADHELAGLSEEQRYDSMHLVSDGRIRSAADAVVPLLGSMLPHVAKAIRALPPAERLLRWSYWRLYHVRAIQGCATEG